MSSSHHPANRPQRSANEFAPCHLPRKSAANRGAQRPAMRAIQRTQGMNCQERSCTCRNVTTWDGASSGLVGSSGVGSGWHSSGGSLSRGSFQSAKRAAGCEHTRRGGVAFPGARGRAWFGLSRRANAPAAAVPLTSARASARSRAARCVARPHGNAVPSAKTFGVSGSAARARPRGTRGDPRCVPKPVSGPRPFPPPGGPSTRERSVNVAARDFDGQHRCGFRAG